MFHYGFDNDSLGLSNYFSNRSQRVRLGNDKSKPISLKLGVPQESVLGPLLFLIFVNDLPFMLKNPSIKMFADDTTINHSNMDLETVVKNFHKDIENLSNWCFYYKIDINWTKTFCMVFSHKKIKISDRINLCGKSIQVVSDKVLLGFKTDHDLNFSKLACSISLIVNKKLFSIKRLFYLSTLGKKYNFSKLLFCLIMIFAHLFCVISQKMQ